MTTRAIMNYGVRREARMEVPSALSRMLEAWAERRRRKRQARQLRALSDHTLKDIGIARCNIDYVVKNTK